jgi:hypothetical protein
MLHGEVLDGDRHELVVGEEEAVVSVFMASEVNRVLTAEEGAIVHSLLPVGVGGRGEAPSRAR